MHDGRYGDGEVYGFMFIAGPTGSGKSFEADRLVANAKRVVKFIPPNVVFDAKGWPVLSQPGQLKAFLAARVGKAVGCIYVPGAGDIEEHFDYVCKLIRAAKNIIFYVDEVDYFCSANGMIGQRSSFWNRPENKQRRPAFSDMLDRGRHDGIAIVAISRVPAQVSRKLTANCQEMRIFRQSEPLVLKYFSDKAGAETADMITRLGDYEYVLWQDGRRPIITGGRK